MPLLVPFCALASVWKWLLGEGLVCACSLLFPWHVRFCVGLVGARNMLFPWFVCLLRGCTCCVVSSLAVSAHGRGAPSSPLALPFRPEKSVSLSWCLSRAKSEARSGETGTGKVSNGSSKSSKGDSPALPEFHSGSQPAGEFYSPSSATPARGSRRSGTPQQTGSGVELPNSKVIEGGGSGDTNLCLRPSKYGDGIALYSLSSWKDLVGELE